MRKFSGDFNKGLTLIEMVIALLLSSIVIVVIFTFVIFAQDVFRGNLTNVELQQNARFSLDKMTRLMRHGDSVLTSLPSSSIQFLDNSQADPGTTHPRYITFYLIGTILKQKTEVYCNPGLCPADPFDPVNSSYWQPQGTPGTQVKTQIVDLAENVSSLQFSQTTLYQISITLTKNSRSVTMQSSVSMRNQ